MLAKIAPCLLLVAVVAPATYGQRVGSAEAYSFMVDQQRRATEDKMDWTAAKKLSRTPDKPGAKIKSELPMERIGDDEVFYASAWHTTVTSIVDATNSIVRIGQDTIWIADFPTDLMSDDLSIRIVDPVKFSGTRSYSTIGGSKKTVRVLKVLTLEEQKKWDAEREKQKAIAREQKLKTMDEFELKDGSKLRAELVSSKNGVVTLMDVDNNPHEIKITDMAPTATANIRKILKQREAKSKQAKKK